MDPIKEAFLKIKQDISEIKDAINLLSDELETQRSSINSLSNRLSDLDRRSDTSKFIKSAQIQTQNPSNPSKNAQIQTNNLNEPPKMPLEAPKTQNTSISIGNEGVQTDRQTDTQTDRHPLSSPGNTQIQPLQAPETPFQESKIDQLQKVSEALDSLDDLKKELRSKFKKLTGQEMLVFQTIYQLQNQGFVVDYSMISQKLNLTQSSIRDHVGNIIKKDIPLEKIRENNKRIILKISPNLTKVASLETLVALRDL